jgi:hypothetical protein
MADVRTPSRQGGDTVASAIESGCIPGLTPGVVPPSEGLPELEETADPSSLTLARDDKGFG